VTSITKSRPFKFVQTRRQRPKPVWHEFYCADCGVRVREFSDPRGSLRLCHACIARRTRRDTTAPPPPPQVQLPMDWWALWCIEYESKKAAGLL